jgi:hypothetical protein
VTTTGARTHGTRLQHHHTLAWVGGGGGGRGGGQQGTHSELLIGMCISTRLWPSFAKAACCSGWSSTSEELCQECLDTDCHQRWSTHMSSMHDSQLLTNRILRPAPTSLSS